MITDPSLKSRVIEIEDDSHTVAELIDGLNQRIPSDASLLATLTLFDDPTPATIETHALWLDLLADLRALSPLQQLQVAAEVWQGTYRWKWAHAPKSQLFDALLAEDPTGTRPWAEAVGQAALAGGLSDRQGRLATSAAAALIRHGQQSDAWINTCNSDSSPEALRAVFENAAPPVRETWTRAHVKLAEFQAGEDARGYCGNRIAALVPVLDLCRDEPLKSHLREAMAWVGSQHRIIPTARDLLEGQIARWQPLRPSEAAKRDVAFKRNECDARRPAPKLRMAPTSASHPATARDLSNALNTFPAWAAASPSARESTIKEVLEKLGDAFERVEPQTKHAEDLSLPRILHRPSGAVMVAVPGGCFPYGLTLDDLLALLLALPEKVRARPDLWTKEFHRELASARPPAMAAVASFLMAETSWAHGKPARPKDEPDNHLLEKARDTLAEFGFRFPRDDEWEWAAREAGRAHFLYDSPDGSAPPSGFNRLGMACLAGAAEWTARGDAITAREMVMFIQDDTERIGRLAGYRVADPEIVAASFRFTCDLPMPVPSAEAWTCSYAATLRALRGNDKTMRTIAEQLLESLESIDKTAPDVVALRAA